MIVSYKDLRNDLSIPGVARLSRREGANGSTSFGTAGRNKIFSNPGITNIFILARDVQKITSYPTDFLSNKFSIHKLIDDFEV